MRELVRIKNAIDVATQFAQIDGAHHKMWVIDQMVRKLLGAEEYKVFVKEYESDGEYSWDTGVAP